MLRLRRNGKAWKPCVTTCAKMFEQLLFVDFESFFDKKGHYDLKSLSMTEYVRSPLFKAHGLGYRTPEGSATWVSNKDIPDWRRRGSLNPMVCSTSPRSKKPSLLPIVSGTWT